MDILMARTTPHILIWEIKVSSKSQQISPPRLRQVKCLLGSNLPWCSIFVGDIWIYFELKNLPNVKKYLHSFRLKVQQISVAYFLCVCFYRSPCFLWWAIMLKMPYSFLLLICRKSSAKPIFIIIVIITSYSRKKSAYYWPGNGEDIQSANEY